jgi:hypothetical protein
MNPSGSIFTPGTSIQGQLTQYTVSNQSSALLNPQATPRFIPIMAKTVRQCGLPAVLPNQDGSLGVFVAGRVHGNSPSFTPWPLSPLYLRTNEGAREWELTQLPDTVHDRPYFVSGVPSVVRDGETVMAYFNGAQLLEYIYSPGHPWRVSAVLTPSIVVEANPVAIITASRVFVFAIPGGTSVLMCSRDLATREWEFRDLDIEALAPFRGFDGDPAVAVFEGVLHVVVAARLETITELWDFMVDPVTLRVKAVPISKRLGEQQEVAASIVGTPSIVAGASGLHVFARSGDDRLLEYFSMDGREWRLTDISISTSKIGGDPGAVLLQDGTPLVCAADQHGNLLQFSTIDNTNGASSANWRATQLSDGENVFERRPIPVLSRSGLSIFDLKVTV